jgi:hypothetical protein
MIEDIFTQLKNFNPPEEDIEFVSMWSGVNHPRTGIPCTEETKQRIGSANRGRVHTEQSRKNMSEAHLGKSNPKSGATRKGMKFTEEHKKNKSLAMKAYWARKREETND